MARLFEGQEKYYRNEHRHIADYCCLVEEFYFDAVPSGLCKFNYIGDSHCEDRFMLSHVAYWLFSLSTQRLCQTLKLQVGVYFKVTRLSSLPGTAQVFGLLSCVFVDLSQF